MREHSKYECPQQNNFLNKLKDSKSPGGFKSVTCKNIVALKQKQRLAGFSCTNAVSEYRTRRGVDEHYVRIVSNRIGNGY